ncbi:MAG: hypothetical protein Solumvirus2_52 [Solumvirus sp.]|uniref:Uncharacterized protein n=1 Tax=Solumvirus sp. TaxID=2487773 RepID=A0A3G5AGA7_9VIRU|nr:MAG: hypothetical protein Solumvirus2_52 [Solumvirus sp.]
MCFLESKIVQFYTDNKLEWWLSIYIGNHIHVFSTFIENIASRSRHLTGVELGDKVYRRFREKYTYMWHVNEQEVKQFILDMMIYP